MTGSSKRQLPTGSVAPDFSLLEPLTGRQVGLADIRGRTGTLVAFLSNHCPYVIHLHAELGRLGVDFKKLGIGMVGICANDVTQYPADGPRHMAALARTVFTTFPYLYDESQDVPRKYCAVCTPDFFLFDKDLILVYRGRLDASRPGSGLPVTGHEMRAAAALMIEGQAVPPGHPSMGCSMKWKLSHGS
jgi:peroxiredoxin